jgi:hypothetical protein
MTDREIVFLVLFLVAVVVAVWAKLEAGATREKLDEIADVLFERVRHAEGMFEQLCKDWDEKWGRLE